MQRSRPSGADGVNVGVGALLRRFSRIMTRAGAPSRPAIVRDRVGQPCVRRLGPPKSVGVDVSLGGEAHYELVERARPVGIALRRWSRWLWRQRPSILQARSIHRGLRSGSGRLVVGPASTTLIGWSSIDADARPASARHHQVCGQSGVSRIAR